MTLTADSIRQGYGDKTVIDDISFELKAGSLISVLGPNGSGTSTLIRTVCGIMKPWSGSISVDGKDISDMEPKELSRNLGYVPQRYMQTDYLKVFDAVLIGRAPYMSWSFSKEDFEHAENAMMRMEVMDLADRYVNDLSGGQMQKIIIARALAQDPGYFILDEPTSALDLKNQMVALRTVKDIVSEGRSGALVAMHDLNLAIRFSDETIMLKDGKVYAMGRPEDVITEESIRDVYGVSSEVYEGKNGRFVHILE